MPRNLKNSVACDRREPTQTDIKMLIGAKLADRASLKDTPTVEQTVSAGAGRAVCCYLLLMSPLS